MLERWRPTDTNGRTTRVELWR